MSEQVCRWIDHGGGSQYSERFWTLDPIDGTKGFLRGEQYAVALALIVDGAGRGRGAGVSRTCRCTPGTEQRGRRSTLGADLPRRERAGGVRRGWRRPGRGRAGRRCGSPSVVEMTRRDARFCESVESGHSAQGDAAAVAARLGITAPPLRMDSQAKYAVVARGEADIYLRLPTRADYREKIWDHAAGALIVAEAGGVVTDIAGRPLEFNHGRELTANRGVIVTNGRLHAQVIEAVRASGIGRRSREWR